MMDEKKNLRDNNVVDLFAFLPQLSRKYSGDLQQKQIQIVYSKILSRFSTIPEKTILFYSAGLIQYENRLYLDALHSFSEALYNRPEYDSALLMRSLTYSRLNKNISAAEDATAASLYNPDNPLTHFIKAIMDFKNKDTASIKAIQRALKLQPDNALFLTLQAAIYQKMNKPEKAFQCAKKAYEIAPEGLTAFNFAKYCTENNISETIKALSAHSDYPPARFFLSQIALAIEPGKAALIVQPLTKHPHYGIPAEIIETDSFIRTREYFKAARSILKIRSRIILNPIYSLILSQCFYLSGCKKSALESINITLRLVEKFSDDKTLMRKTQILKCKILLKIPDHPVDNIRITLKTLLNHIDLLPDEKLQIERMYRKLYHFTGEKKDKNEAKRLRDSRLNGKNINNASIPKWVYGTVIIILILLLLLEVLSRYSK